MFWWSAQRCLAAKGPLINERERSVLGPRVDAVGAGRCVLAHPRKSAQAGRAHVALQKPSVNQQPSLLNVWLEQALRVALGVADVIAGLRALVADVALQSPVPPSGWQVRLLRVRAVGKV